MRELTVFCFLECIIYSVIANFAVTLQHHMTLQVFVVIAVGNGLLTYQH